jgi:hypothetical protein
LRGFRLSRSTTHQEEVKKKKKVEGEKNAIKFRRKRLENDEGRK